MSMFSSISEGCRHELIYLGFRPDALREGGTNFTLVLNNEIPKLKMVIYNNSNYAETGLEFDGNTLSDGNIGYTSVRKMESVHDLVEEIYRLKGLISAGRISLPKTVTKSK